MGELGGFCEIVLEEGVDKSEEEGVSHSANRLGRSWLAF
jgi:hypothetical protein